MAPAPEGGPRSARLTPGAPAAAGPLSVRGRAGGEGTQRRRRRFKYDNEAKFPETAAATHRLHVRLPLPPSAAFSNNFRQSAAPGAVTRAVPTATADAAGPGGAGPGARGGAARRSGGGRERRGRERRGLRPGLRGSGGRAALRDNAPTSVHWAASLVLFVTLL